MKRGGVALLFFIAASAFAGDGILSRYGTGERSAATEILIINGQAYTAPAGTAARIRQQQEADSLGDAAARAAGQPPGNFVGSDGALYQGTAGGWINTQNGQFVPR